MKKAFAFLFTDDFNPGGGIFKFMEIDLESIDVAMENKLFTLCGPLEDAYGIHEGSGGERFEYNGEKYEAIYSFFSYEVDFDKADELMEKWKSVFEDDLSVGCGDIVTISEAEYNSIVF